MIGRRGRCVIVVCCALVVSACGIPLDEAPETIAIDELPIALQATTSTTSSTLPPQLTEDVAIYLVDPGDGEPRLVAVDRQIALVESGTELESLILEQLFAGPINEEQIDDNLTTLLIPSADDPLAVLSTSRPADGRIDIVLTEAPSVEGAARIAAFAQIVFTLTELDSIDEVGFLVRTEEGTDEFISVLTDTEEGDVSRPVGRDDFPGVRPLFLPN